MERVCKSRVGGKPIVLTDGVTVDISEEAVLVRGKRGMQTVKVGSFFQVALSGKELRVIPSQMNQFVKKMWGTLRQSLFNAVSGVSDGFEKDLAIVGVGYRVLKVEQNVLHLKIGFSHDVVYRPAVDVQITSENPNSIKVSGVSKEMVGKVAADLVAIRPAEPYKGKGIRYAGEHITLKPGKNK